MTLMEGKISGNTKKKEKNPPIRDRLGRAGCAECICCHLAPAVPVNTLLLHQLGVLVLHVVSVIVLQVGARQFHLNVILDGVTESGLMNNKTWSIQLG